MVKLCESSRRAEAAASGDAAPLRLFLTAGDAVALLGGASRRIDDERDVPTSRSSRTRLNATLRGRCDGVDGVTSRRGRRRVRNRGRVNASRWNLWLNSSSMCGSEKQTRRKQKQNAQVHESRDALTTGC